ncbi:MarR family winged helix-turn-helix transcriptional regulator [Azohydromonas aeria]|uniref:MarR family winged helix-turn-helix transcriptional regulator n=1 Tax=Azohydromonas aeria TaxID=2590212 RepID=UPI0012FB1707|nr:MarR family transcriptional regulator [Azohydromonas aeria]
MTTDASTDSLSALPALDDLPGHFIRRLQQIAVALFMDELKDWNLTPVQYAALNAAARMPDIEQGALARAIGFDTSTTGGVVDRLERQGLLLRKPSPSDRRVRLLGITEAGRALLDQVGPAIATVQERILAPLPIEERPLFLRMLRTLVEANNELSRAPRELPDGR